jgi:pyruvate-ferredoxin/flavodoxin oxidoreductase
MPLVVGGRYGLASKEFTPAMVKAVLDALAAERPRNHFT